MNQAQQRPGEDKTPFLSAVFAIPLLFFVLTAAGFLLGQTGVIGLRAIGKPQTLQIDALIANESALLNTISPKNPVRALTQIADHWLRKGAAFAANGHPGIIPQVIIQDAISVTHIIVRRGVIALLILIPLLPILWAAFQDGLATRELRKFGNDKESSVRFAAAKRAVPIWMSLLTLSYLLWPQPIHPMALLLALTATMGPCLAIAVGRFKKYL
jgi:Domain of unknown function (DUF4400)